MIRCLAARLLVPLSLLVAVLALPALVSARGTSVDLPAIFHRQIPTVKKKTSLPIYLPGRVPSEFAARRLFPSGFGSRRSYGFGLESARRCGGANACFVGSFRGRRGEKPFGRRVALTGGVRGYFTPTGCGASCSASIISFARGGVLYTFQYRSGAKLRSAREKSVMIGLANSALRAGPR